MSDKYIQGLWRKAVLKTYGNRCFICGKYHHEGEGLEAHHIVKRNYMILRHDWRNGIPVCSQGACTLSPGGLTCHEYAATLAGIAFIHLRSQYYEYLIIRSQIPISQYIVEVGMSRQDLFNKQKNELLSIINGITK